MNSKAYSKKKKTHVYSKQENFWTINSKWTSCKKIVSLKKDWIKTIKRPCSKDLRSKRCLKNMIWTSLFHFKSVHRGLKVMIQITNLRDHPLADSWILIKVQHRKKVLLGTSKSSTNVKTKNGYLFLQRSANLEENLSFTGTIHNLKSMGANKAESKLKSNLN